MAMLCNAALDAVFFVAKQYANRPTVCLAELSPFVSPRRVHEVFDYSDIEPANRYRLDDMLSALRQSLWKVDPINGVLG